MNNCKYCGAELSPTFNCTGCGSSTGEAEDIRYVCHNCGNISDIGGICSCGHSYDRI
jgi:hypothetical protein